MGSGGLPAVIWAIVALGVLWLAVAIGVSVLAARRFRLAENVLGAARASAALLELAPARPMVVRTDGRVEIDAQLARELGLEGSSERLDELAGEENGIAADDLAALQEEI